jgi:hypothetical protein
MIDLVKEKLKSKNLKFDKEKVALTFEEGDDYYGISYNYMGTGIHIPLNKVDEEKCKEQGIKVWRTWTYKTN